MNEYETALLEYLKTATPDMWHQIVWNWNWDDGHDAPVKWILNNPECDKGTALLVYWYLNPRYFSQYENADEVRDYERVHYDLIKEIEKKYLEGFYKNENIIFDPANDFDGHDWTREYSDIEMKVTIPELMYQATKGEKVERQQIDEGYPQEVLDQIETHDHSMATHSAKCDAEGCEYIAQVHAHDDDEAVDLLSQNLAEHNMREHNITTIVEEIKDPVRAKMKKITN